MKIWRAEDVRGLYYTPVPGQSRYGYAVSDTEDFDEVPAWAARGGYQGATIHFLDYETGKVYVPFEKKRDVTYGRPVSQEGKLYFLQGDFGRGEVRLFAYLPGEEPEEACMLAASEVDLYNLQAVPGDVVRVVSQGKSLCGYWPERFEVPLEPNETVEFIEKDRIWLSAWVEEGLCGEQITDKYRYYETLVVKDYDGQLLQSETGCLPFDPLGRLWFG